MNVVGAILAIVGAYGTGVVAALTGIGGGVILVPYLSLVLGLPLKVAGAVSLLSMVSITTVASARYLVYRFVDNVRTPIYALGAIIGGVLGGAAASRAGERFLAAVLSVILFYSSLHMLGFREEEGARREAPFRPLVSLSISIVRGVIPGLLGIGGGSVVAPLLLFVEGLPIRVAVASNSFVTAVASSAALSVRLPQLEGLWYAPLVALAASAGSYTGSIFMPRIPARHLAVLLAVILLIVSGVLMLKALGVTA
ncbi:sulfite exporter TauE/SafE family protein [Stetteria hydrogenophila]